MAPHLIRGEIEKHPPERIRSRLGDTLESVGED